MDDAALLINSAVSNHTESTCASVSSDYQCAVLSADRVSKIRCDGSVSTAQHTMQTTPSNVAWPEPFYTLVPCNEQYLSKGLAWLCLN